MNRIIDLSTLNHNRFDFSDIFNDYDLNDEYENEFYDNFNDIQAGKYIIVLNYFICSNLIFLSTSFYNTL